VKNLLLAFMGSEEGGRGSEHQNIGVHNLPYKSHRMD
jgi:hypothetical protein